MDLRALIGGPTTPLTADMLKRQQRRQAGSSRSTKSSGSRYESDHRKSATTRTTRSGNGDNEMVTFKVVGGRAQIDCADGGEIEIKRQKSIRNGSEHGANSEYGGTQRGRLEDLRSRIERPPGRSRISSRSNGSYTRTTFYQQMPIDRQHRSKQQQAVQDQWQGDTNGGFQWGNPQGTAIASQQQQNLEAHASPDKTPQISLSDYKAAMTKKTDTANASKASSGGSLTVEAQATIRGPPQAQPAEIGRDSPPPLSLRAPLKRQMNQVAPQDGTEVHSERTKKICVSYTISEDMSGDRRNKILSRIGGGKCDNGGENLRMRGSYADSWSLKTLAAERFDDNRGVASSNAIGDRSQRAPSPGRCHSCNRAETPEWRRGPGGARTLCNACGLHYAKLTRKNTLKQSQGSNGSSLRPKSIDEVSPDFTFETPRI